ncbi:MAG: hypothetical protein KatS3mg054_0458 [Chloroflexus sp.]|nr:MAG: hypothetical protein KatS3mg054_0426 [Chloroflexus sp.]GIV86429.1 MAG: hypothetical protein KatS3mg054_0458 [Chloroflexus sp.]
MMITTTFLPVRDEQGAVRLSVRKLVLEDEHVSVGLTEQGIEMHGKSEGDRRAAQKLAGELLMLLSDKNVTWEQVVLWLAERGVALRERDGGGE